MIVNESWEYYYIGLNNPVTGSFSSGEMAGKYNYLKFLGDKIMSLHNITIMGKRKGSYQYDISWLPLPAPLLKKERR